MSDGNLIGFKIFFNSKGVMMSELSQLPIKDIDKVFNTTEEKQIVKTVIQEAYKTLAGLHEDLEKELNALNTRIV
jgi:glycerate kinase